MSYTNPGAQAWEPAEEESSGRAEAAREQAADLKDQATSSAHKVAGTARDEAGNVLHESKSQVRGLFEQARTELGEQAAHQQSKVAEGLRSVSDELKEMASASSNGGVASDLVGQASARTSSVASWLDARDPGSLVEELRTFAGRKPLAFLAAAAAAGVLAGRLTRSVSSASASENENKNKNKSESKPEPVTPKVETPIYSSVADSYPTTDSYPVPPATAVPAPPLADERTVSQFNVDSRS